MSLPPSRFYPRANPSGEVRQQKKSPAVNISLAPAPPHDDGSPGFSATVAELNRELEFLTVAEFTRGLVEEDCPEYWLLKICARARPDLTGAVRLSYGNGYETTVLLQGAELGGKVTPTSIGVGLTIAPLGSDPWGPGVLDILPTNVAYDHVMGYLQSNEVPPVLYVRTHAGEWWFPNQQEGGQRTIRVWSEPGDPLRLGRMEVEEAPATAPKKKRKRKATQDEDGAKKPAAKKSKPAQDGDAAKKTSSKKGKASDDGAAKPTAKKTKSADEDSKMPAAKKIAPEPAASEDDNEDEMGSEINEDMDSDLEEARKKAKKSKKRAAEEENDDDDGEASVPKKKAKEKKSSVASEGNTKSKKGSKKKGKDPNAPKRASSSYILFANAHRLQVKEENPDLNFANLNKLLGAKFNVLSEDERKEWVEKADQEKQRYKKEMESYSAPEDSDGDDDEKPKKKKKDPNAPKRALSAYNFFVNENRSKIQKKHPDASFGELAKIVGAQYQSLTSDERAKYDEMATADKLRHEKEMAEYVPSKGAASEKKAKAKKDSSVVKKVEKKVVADDGSEDDSDDSDEESIVDDSGDEDDVDEEDNHDDDDETVSSSEVESSEHDHKGGINKGGMNDEQNEAHSAQSKAKKTRKKGTPRLSWDERFQQLQDYEAEKGDCMVPTHHHSLGGWVQKQRSDYKKFTKGEPSSMTKEHIDQLENIGFVWEAKKSGRKSAGEETPAKETPAEPEDEEKEHDHKGGVNKGGMNDEQNEAHSAQSKLKEARKKVALRSWDVRFQQLQDYKAEKGDCLVPTNSPGLGRWVLAQRAAYKKFNKGEPSHMTKDHIDQLESIGFVWEMNKKWVGEETPAKETPAEPEDEEEEEEEAKEEPAAKPAAKPKKPRKPSAKMTPTKERRAVPEAGIEKEEAKKAEAAREPVSKTKKHRKSGTKETPVKDTSKKPEEMEKSDKADVAGGPATTPKKHKKRKKDRKSSKGEAD